MEKFSNEEYWKSIILYGLNVSTYKIALGKTLLSLSKQGKSTVTWEHLSLEFLNQYKSRLNIVDPMPQLDNPSRKTVMERIVEASNINLSLDEAVSEVGKNAFGDVIHRFHNLGESKEFLGKFYKFKEGKYIELTDAMFSVYENNLDEVHAELDARWSLLEGAFTMKGHDYKLSNDIRLIYLQGATKRKSLTDQVPFLQGYQGNLCFYCGEPINKSDCHVDHVLPRQVLNHDEVWNLVLTHAYCNLNKDDNLVGPHYIQKLIHRNENIMRSNHPWKEIIKNSLGKTPNARKSNLTIHYENVKNVLGVRRYWGGISHYNPEKDLFYKKLISNLYS
jgi:5-methylcytosine-specific restriction endonuclease McrA